MLTVATWNVQWASRRSRRFEAVQRRVAELAADILVLTETTRELIPADGFSAEGGTDWGYRTSANRRKVVLWSRWPISRAENDLVVPEGRHLVANVETPIGPVRVHAVCVPWAHAHVSSGRRDRRPWEDHLTFLQELSRLLHLVTSDPDTRELPVIIAGDVNQRAESNSHGSAAAHAAWAALGADGALRTVTDEQVLDKVAIGPGLIAEDATTYPPDGLSDHAAVSCRVGLA